MLYLLRKYSGCLLYVRKLNHSISYGESQPEFVPAGDFLVPCRLLPYQLLRQVLEACCRVLENCSLANLGGAGGTPCDVGGGVVDGLHGVSPFCVDLPFGVASP